MHVGELAERTGLSIRTIRHYDEMGLITPSGRTAGGFRLYTEDDYERALLVKAMKPLGYSLEQMRNLLVVVDAVVGDRSNPEFQRQLSELEAEATVRREELTKNLAVAERFVESLAHYRSQ